MDKQRIPSELEQRLTREVMEKVEGKPRIDPIETLHQTIKKSREESALATKKSTDESKRATTMFFRFFSIPLSICTCLYLFSSIFGLSQGEVMSVGKYSHSMVSFYETPYLFCFSLIYHLCMTAIFFALSIRCWRGAKWFKKTALSPVGRMQPALSISTK